MKDIKLGFILDLHGRNTNPIARIDNYPLNILKKVQIVLKENDIIVFCGDIFNTYLIPTNFVNKLLNLLTFYENKGKKILMIPGNHDLIGRDYNTWQSTSFGTLCLGRDWYLKSIYEFENICIIPLTFDTEGTPIVSDSDVISNKHKILVGHAYFNHEDYKDKWNVDSDIIRNFNLCILGHDHQEYEPVQCGECTLLRCGSISRNTIDDTNRIPKYIQVVCAQESLTYSYKTLPCDTIENTFKGRNTTEKELKKYHKDIHRIIELLQVKQNNCNNLTNALKEIECPDKYIEIINEVLDG